MSVGSDGAMTKPGSSSAITTSHGRWRAASRPERESATAHACDLTDEHQRPDEPCTPVLFGSSRRKTRIGHTRARRPVAACVAADERTRSGEEQPEPRDSPPHRRFHAPRTQEAPANRGSKTDGRYWARTSDLRLVEAA